MLTTTIFHDEFKRRSAQCYDSVSSINIMRYFKLKGLLREARHEKAEVNERKCW